MNLSDYTELNICAFIQLLNRSIHTPEPNHPESALYLKVTDVYRKFAHPVTACQKTRIHVKYIDSQLDPAGFIPGQIEVVLTHDHDQQHRLIQLPLDQSGNIVDVILPSPEVPVRSPGYRRTL